MSLYAAAGILVLFPLFSAVTLTGCDGGGGGGAAENTGNDDSGDTGTGDDTSGGDTGGTEPEVRIVLANAMNTAAADDIEPVNIYDSQISYDALQDPVTFNTLFFEANQFEAGKKYIFNGELDSEGKVKDQIYIRSTGVVPNFTDIDIEINNAIILVGHLRGDSVLTFDMPCYHQIEAHGTIIKYSPKPPLDKVPVLEADVVSPTTVIYAPLYSKKRIAGEAPVDIY